MTTMQINQQEREIVREWSKTPRKPNFSAFEKSMKKRVASKRIAVAPADVWSLADHKSQLWNQALDEAENNVKILYSLYESEWLKGNEPGAMLHYNEANAWYSWYQTVFSSTHDQYFEYYLSRELGLES